MIHAMRRHQAHFPSSAISAQPSSIEHTAYVSFEFDEFIISLLNKNSCASSCKRVSDKKKKITTARD
jgi:hypothetical protein